MKIEYLFLGCVVFLTIVNVLLSIELRQWRERHEIIAGLLKECEQQPDHYHTMDYLSDSGNIVLTYPYYEWRKGRDVIQSLTPIWTDEQGRPYEHRHGKRWYLHPGDSWRNNSGYRTPP